ncbi:MAG: AEC family transporter [Oscillospiraceae bacterium]|nr:AEC family transporter [Oscillospiraceae bacterium]
MSSFVFALNSTMPVFLVMVLGYFLRRVGMLTRPFCDVGDRFVFQVALPVLLFCDIMETDLYQDFDWTFVIFCALGTTVMFFGVWGAARLFLKDKSMVGAFAQASARSSAAILGIAFVQNMYGDSGMMPLMIVAAVPLFNIYSVIILTFSAADSAGNQGAIKRACINVCKNPVIIGILLGLIASLLRVQLPVILDKAVSNVGSLATPLALLIVGANFEGKKALVKLKPTAWATAIKLLILPAVFLPAAIALGFRDSALVAVLIMTGSPTTVSCYIMAKNMGNDAVLTSSIVVSATLLSSVTLTFWIFLLQMLGYI